MGSIPTRKGTTLHSNKGYFHLWLPNSVPTQGHQNCNRLQTVCVNPCLTGFGWTLFFNWKGQFFPSFYSWCGTFDPNVYLRTNQSKPTCMWTGWRLQVTQKTILNQQYMNHGHQGEGDPKERVQWYSLPNLELMVLLDPSLTPALSCCCSSSGRRAPDDNYLALYIVHEAQDDIHWWCKDCIIKHHTSSQTLSAGDKWWELGTLTSYRQVRATQPNF